MPPTTTSHHSPHKMLFLPDSPLIQFTGRWATGYLSWWASTGFNVSVPTSAKVRNDLTADPPFASQVGPATTSLSLLLGNKTTQPHVSIALSIDRGPWIEHNVTAGSNELALEPAGNVSRSVRVVTEGWQNNRLELLGLDVNGVGRQGLFSACVARSSRSHARRSSDASPRRLHYTSSLSVTVSRQ